MKLRLYKTETIEVVIDKATGETYASISATARMCKVTNKTIRAFIKTWGENGIKSAKVQTTQGMRSGNLLNEDRILDCLYKYNPQLTRSFARLGLRKFLHAEVGYRHQQNKFLYPDRSQEYRDLYEEIKDLMKQTHSKPYHYITLNQTLNRIVGKVEGRSNNVISEVENLAYCLLMKKAVTVGKLFIDKTNGYNTRLVINRQLEKLHPQIVSIQNSLKLLE